jgi:hypothetical protein
MSLLTQPHSVNFPATLRRFSGEIGETGVPSSACNTFSFSNHNDRHRVAQTGAV